MISHLSEDVALAAQKNFDLEHVHHFLDMKKYIYNFTQNHDGKIIILKPT